MVWLLPGSLEDRILARHRSGKRSVMISKQRSQGIRLDRGRVMVFMSYEKTGKKTKLALPYHRPFRNVEVLPNGVSVRPVDRPQDERILVNVDRVTPSPDEFPETSSGWAPVVGGLEKLRL